MFLRSLHIRDVRSIEEFDLSFLDDSVAADAEPDEETRKWTWILGDNGTGKSTILRAIALLTAGSDALPDLMGDVSSWIRSGKDQCSMSAEIQTKAGERRQIGLTLQRSDTIRDVFSRNGETLGELDSALKNSLRSYLTLGYGVSRHAGGSEEGSLTPKGGRQRHPRAQSVATLFFPDVLLNPLQSWAMQLDYRRGEEGVELVRDSLNALLPGIRFSHIDRQRGELIFATPDGKVPYSLLSDGYQNVAAWVGDLLYQLTEIFEEYQDPLAARGVLLVDEVGLHLHPNWQRQLKEFIDSRMPNLQLVTTTHSALAAHQAGEGELFFLRRDQDDRVDLEAYDGAPNKLMLHQLLLSPAFGLATVDSKVVEDKRQRYRQLKAQSDRSDSESAQLSELAEELADLPDWSGESQTEQKIAKIFDDIKQAVES